MSGGPRGHLPPPLWGEDWSGGEGRLEKNKRGVEWVRKREERSGERGMSEEGERKKRKF